VINWEPCGDGVICLFTGHQIRWLRDSIVGYRDRIDAALDNGHDDVPEADSHPLVQVRTLLTTLLNDVPEYDNVVVFRGDGHRVAWAWLLDLLRTMREPAGPVTAEWHESSPGELSTWLFELIEFLLGRKPSTME